MDYARMRAIAEELMKHAPDPIRGVEITHDGIIMMMSPSRPHELIAMRLRRQLDPQLDNGLVAHSGGEIEDVSLGKLRRPDLIVVPEEVFAEETMAPFDPHDLAMVSEIVSPSNHSTDYTDKMDEYPAMGIPLYLLIDPRKGTVAVMSDPGPGSDGQPCYRARHDYVFGDKVTVGPWTIDSSEFRTYPS
ncbi:Uma2 family endonuclease [Streptomyces sp. NPDC001678]|uniref:Uma2 family endonuclease n=1 Tax=Streptomyces sp. NPDC001678 TaxID=3364599 RepID=UPI00367F7903